MYTGSCFCKNIKIELKNQPFAIVSSSSDGRKKKRKEKKD